MGVGEGVCDVALVVVGQNVFSVKDYGVAVDGVIVCSILQRRWVL